MEKFKRNYNTTNYLIALEEGFKKHTTYPTLQSWKVHAEIVWKNSWWSFLLSLLIINKTVSKITCFRKFYSNFTRDAQKQGFGFWNKCQYHMKTKQGPLSQPIKASL